jgi:hypothetical protein
MFSAFTSSVTIGCTCGSSCSHVCFETSWCVTCYSCFLRLLITTFDIFWNQQVLGKPLIFFNINISKWPLPIVRSLYKTFFIDWVPNLFQKNYTNLALFPNSCKLNQETTWILKNTKTTSKKWYKLEFQVWLFFKHDLLKLLYPSRNYKHDCF